MSYQPVCIACERQVQHLTFTRICSECTENIIVILEVMEKEVRGLEEDYTHAFENLNEEDAKRRDIVLKTHEGIKELVYFRQRNEATAKFHNKIKKTIERDDEFAKAVKLWFDYIMLKARFEDVRFNSISIKNEKLGGWVSGYAKRKNR